MATLEETRVKLRAFLRDYEEENVLIDHEESSDANLDLGIELAIEEFNMSPPVIDPTYTIEDFPSPAMLIYGAAIHVLISTGIKYSRNELSFNDGGVSQVIFNKDGKIQA